MQHNMENENVQDLVVYGAGGLGREMAALIRAIDPQGKQWRMAGFIDDSFPADSIVDDSLVLGGKTFLSRTERPLSVVMGIASPSAKYDIYQSLKDHSLLSFPILIHPTAWVEPSAQMAPGAVIGPFCFVAISSCLGICTFMNVSSQLGHDAKLGDFCSVMPGAAVAGNVRVGSRTLIGAGVKILQGLNIGSQSTVGMGSVVLKDVPSRATAMGYPARVVKKDDV